MVRNSWFNISAKADGSAEIDIFDEIGFWGVTAKDFVKALREHGGVKSITLNIDCPGGSCEDGFTIYDAIKGTNATVTANVMGTAASMASVIMLAAKRITIAENGRVMIHRVTAGGMGNADDLDAVAKITRQFEDRIVRLYVERTGAKEEKVREWMKAEMGTWFFGQEAVDAGFADAVTTGAKARAFKPEWAGMFTVVPGACFDKRASAESKAELQLQSDTEMTIDEIKALIAEALKPVQAQLAKLNPGTSNADLEALQNLLKEEMGTGLKDITAKIETITTDVKALGDVAKRLETLENVVKSGVAASAGGRPGVDTRGGGEGGKSEKEELADKYHAASPSERTRMMKEHGMPKILEACNAYPEKKKAA